MKQSFHVSNSDSMNARWSTARSENRSRTLTSDSHLASTATARFACEARGGAKCAAVGASGRTIATVTWPGAGRRRHGEGLQRRADWAVCGATQKAKGSNKDVCRNRKARFNYEVLEVFEAGIELKGSEVKSARAGKVSLAESFARVTNGELILLQCNISPHENTGNYDQHEPSRKRRLLVHKKQIRKLKEKQEQQGLSVIPLRMYFSRGWLKVELGLCKVKNTHDKRETMKKRDTERKINQALKVGM